MKTPDEQQLSTGQLMFAGGFSAIPTTVVMAPGERIKCLLQIQAQAMERGEPKLYDGMLDCGKKLYRQGGLSSVFRGWEATLLRDVPAYVVFGWVCLGVYQSFSRHGVVL
jgi:solute carrier family 25 (mitochondrial carnitine/acylcarnitine transporter), member 20/29